jgi:outer membrane protein insertion porin family
MMRAFDHRLVFSLGALGALIASAAIAPSHLQAQGGGGRGGLNSLPGTMFGQKDEELPAFSGPSLSATDEPVAEIRVVGNKAIPTTQVLNQLQTRVGRPFDPAMVQSDVRKLLSRGWFVDVRPAYERTDTGDHRGKQTD